MNKDFFHEVKKRICMIDIYMINGFLESGKSEFIKYTISQPYFQIRGKTLLILCEEGEVEFEQELLDATRTVVEVIDEEEDFNSTNLIDLEKKYKPSRIIIEWNGMWNPKEMKLPWYWKVEQQITTVNAQTFPMYYTNMRSLVAEQIRKSEMVIFNRADGIDDLASYKRNVKAINQQCDIIFEGAEGEINLTLDEDLPYDVTKDVIELDDMGYGIWYLDALDFPDRYAGKKVVFTAQVMHPKGFPADYFVPGRMAMTCCADDMAFLGFATQADNAASFKEKEWVRVTASLTMEKSKFYEGQEGPILHAVSVETTAKPKDEVINFT